MGESIITRRGGGGGPIITIDGIKVKEAINFESDCIVKKKKKSTLPYQFYRGSAVVYNNEIHILGSSNSSNNTYPYATNHYIILTTCYLPLPVVSS